jgi:hypothetical protein
MTPWIESHWKPRKMAKAMAPAMNRPEQAAASVVLHLLGLGAAQGRS